MSLNRDILYKLCEDAPGDFTVYAGLADELDELGYASLAHAYRWMAARRKCPHKREWYAARLPYARGFEKGRRVPGASRWAWYAVSRSSYEVEITKVWPLVRRETHALSPLLISGPQLVFTSSAAAVMCLAKWLSELRECYDVNEPKRGL